MPESSGPRGSWNVGEMGMLGSLGCRGDRDVGRLGTEGQLETSGRWGRKGARDRISLSLIFYFYCLLFYLFCIMFSQLITNGFVYLCFYKKHLAWSR